jgi:hypothetical protein
MAALWSIVWSITAKADGKRLPSNTKGSVHMMFSPILAGFFYIGGGAAGLLIVVVVVVLLVRR